ncbi:T9SS type A sorting domain-containing protein, partial [Salegentibacter sediminis]|uniref:T9SS type A sorting domain-containing protein n=1 Tax=Salegentibacter sediminis TaxID=1930251 RepID=UPI0012FF97EE
NDHGDNWTYVSTVNHYLYGSGFFFVDENTGYSIGGGTSDVFKTTNGGITWNKLEITVDEGLSSIYFINEDIGFISGGYNRKKVMKTVDGGNTWNKVLDTEFGNIQFLNTQVGYGNRIGYFGGRLYKTIDGGNTWDYILEVDQDINSFHFIDENIGYIIGDNALIQKTDDGGATWKELSIPYEYYELVKFYTEDIGFIVDEEGKIYKTEDGGENWKFLTIHYGTRSIELTNEHIFTAGSNGKIYRSETGFDLENEIDTDIFSIKVSHETCAGKNNGIILIETSEENEFSVSINGENYKFTQRLLLEDLPAEHYSFCITTESNPDFEQCFESIIKPGGELEGRIQSQNQFKEVFVKVNIEKGTGPFLATLNGEVLGIYNSSTFTINTGKEGILEITSNKLCEGTLLFNIENTTSVFAYPNPTSSYINISIPETRFSQVPVSIYNNSGQLFYSDKKTVKNKTITLQVEDFSTGVYYVILKLETPRILKFYKK